VGIRGTATCVTPSSPASSPHPLHLAQSGFLSQLGKHGHVQLDLRIHAQNRCGRSHFLSLNDGVVGNHQDVRPFHQEGLDLGIHPGLQEPLAVVQADNDGEHGDVLLVYGLGLHLLHDPGKGPARIGLNHHRRFQPRFDLAHVGLVDQHPDLDLVQVSHDEESRAPGDTPRRRLNDRTLLNTSGQDGPDAGSPDGHVVPLEFSQFLGGLGFHQRGLGVGIVRPLALELLLGNDPRLEQLGGTLQLGLGNLSPNNGNVQISFGLFVGVDHIPGIDFRQKVPWLNQVPHIHVKSEHLTGGLRFHLDLSDRFYIPGGFSSDSHVLPEDRTGLKAGGFRCFTPAASGQSHHNHPQQTTHHDPEGSIQGKRLVVSNSERIETGPSEHLHASAPA